MVTWDNYEEYLMLQADGELNEAGEQELQQFIVQHPELADELALYQNIRLQPDTTLVLPNKELLLKEEPKPRRIALNGWWSYGAAASVVIALILFSLFRKQDNKTATLAKATHTAPVANQAQSPATLTQQAATQQAVARNNTKTITNPIHHQPPKPAHHHYTPTQPTITTDDIATISAAPLKPLSLPAGPQPVLATVKPAHTTIPPTPETTEQTNNDNQSLLALLPLEDSKKQGLETVKNVVTTSITEVKNFQENIRQADISFKIKGKQLAVVIF